MQKKGQVNVGAVIIAAVIVIVGLVLLQASAGFIGTASNQVTATNVTYTSAANGLSIDLDGQELFGTVTIVNASNVSQNWASNFTVAEGVSPRTGVKRILLTTGNTTVANRSVNVSYTYGSEGYIDDAGGRAIAGIIVLLFGLAISISVLSPTLREKFLESIGR